jgi:hypothetical protein
MTADQRRALDMLAGSPHGVAEPFMRAHGFTPGWSRARRLAVATPESVKAGGKMLSVVRVTVTDARQPALAE